VTTLTQTKTLSDCIKDFLLIAKFEGKSPETLDWYRSKLTAFTNFAEANGLPQSPTLLTKSHLLMYLDSIQERPRFDKRPGRISVYARKGHFATLRAFFYRLKGEGIIEESPLKGIKAPKLPKLTIPTFTAEDIRKMLEVCDSILVVFIRKRTRAMILLFLDTGVRLSELNGIKLQDIDWERGFIAIKGKGDKERVVHFGNKAMAALNDYLSVRKSQTDRLWVSPTGGAISKYAIERVVKRVCRKAGITGVRCSPHTFRHTFAVNFLAQGGDSLLLKELLGHETLLMTEHYTRHLRGQLALQAHKRFSPADAMVQ